MNDGFEDMVKLSYYKEIAVLNENHNIYMVQHTESSKTYVKKLLSIYNKKVYEQIASHPISGTPRIIDICEANGRLVIIEEYISGKTLLELMDESGPLPESEVIRIVEALCDILHSLHSLTPPIIHRDIKPSNIMITEDNRVILLDLNGAKQENPTELKDTHLIGTHGFAAPEQYGFGASSVQTDLYSTGVLMTVLLTGSIDGKSKCSGAFRRVIDKCTRLDSEKRYDSALQLKKAVSAIKNKTRKLISIACATVFVLILLIGLFFYLCSRSKEDGRPVQELSGEAPTMAAANTRPASTVTNSPTPAIAETDSTESNSDTPAIAETDSTEADSTATDSASSPAGVYSGNDGELLVLAENGMAYYYCYDVSYTELECPWEYKDNILSIEFAKMHCTATADLSRGTEELILKSKSLSWNSEVFDNLHQDPAEYIIDPPSASKEITVLHDGTMQLQVDNIGFSIPRHFIDYGNDDRDYYILIDVSEDNNYHAELLFCETDEISSSILDTQYIEAAEAFTERFMDNLQIGFSEAITVAGRPSYSVTVSGLLNEGFGGIKGKIYSGRTVLIPKADKSGIVVLFMSQLIGSKMDNSKAFDSIVKTAVPTE
ncbi:MAG: protein kinase [Lachnospiraceae bacterium]|nr:protein kinase [Lachnospiraceae bacterium]